MRKKICIGDESMGKWRDMPFTWSIGFLTLLFSIVGFTNGDIAMGVILLAVTIGLFALGYYLIVRESKPNEAQQQKEQISSNVDKASIVEQNRDLFSPPYFDGLFRRLAHFQEFGIHNYIDIILYATYKARICATMFISESNLDDVKKHKVIDAYDRFQYLSLDGWLEQNAGSFTGRSNIIDSRITAYEETLLNNKSNLNSMNLLSRAFYWMLDNGWELNSEGKFTETSRKYFDIQTLINAEYLDKKHSMIQDEVEVVTYSYCQRELPSLISFFVSDISKQS